MRILHVVYSLVPGSYRGGISKVAFELGAAQAAEGHEVTIFTTDVQGGRRVEVTDVNPAPNLSLRYFEGKTWPRFSSPAMFSEMKRQRDRFDVVHSHNNFLKFNVYVRKAFAGRVPIFFQAHGSLDRTVMRKGLLKSLKKSCYFRLVERRNLKEAAGMFASTESEVFQLKALGVPCPVHVYANGINPVRATRQDGVDFRMRHGIKEEKLIVYVGRIHWKKGVERLIRAFASFSQAHPDYGLVIGGPPDQYAGYGEMVQHLCTQLNVSERVYWPGFLPEIEKCACLSAAHVFSHVSESEGMAMVVLEAMSAGLPVVVGEGCYMGEAARVGALVEIAPDVEELAGVFNRLAGDSALAASLGTCARAYVAENHSWREIAQQVVGFYSRAR